MFNEIEKELGETGTYYTKKIISLAILEDEKDLTSDGIFSENDISEANLISREKTSVVGLILIPLILEEMGLENVGKLIKFYVSEGDTVENNTKIATIKTKTALLLKAERIILNFITHLSGIANLTKQYLKELEGTKVKLNDTRKTLPGLRYLEKYAVKKAGGFNHRLNLSHMLMIKNNHIDASKSISNAVEKLRSTYLEKCPPIIVECRNQAEVLEAVQAKPSRILLDNMDTDMLNICLPLIPKEIDAEISGGVSLANIRKLALSSPTRPADFISVGRITHSAPIADFSLRINRIYGDI